MLLNGANAIPHGAGSAISRISPCSKKTYDEIPKRERAYWEKNGGEECWREFGAGGTKVPTGFISGKGEFFDHVLKVPLHHNMMMVYRVGKRWKP